MVDIIDSETEITKKIIESDEPPSLRNQKIILIDAGHGGEDSGAVGRNKITRKKCEFGNCKKTCWPSLIKIKISMQY